jgi:hypothetical protein
MINIKKFNLRHWLHVRINGWWVAKYFNFTTFVITKAHSSFHGLPNFPVQPTCFFQIFVSIIFKTNTVCSLIKLKATVTSRLPAGTAIILVSWFYCLYGPLLDSYRQNLVALGGESCSFSREVIAAFNFISEHAVFLTPLFRGYAFWPVTFRIN